ncbi:aminotransferase-like domain-containing protein [Streptomyces sp. NPDC001758]
MVIRADTPALASRATDVASSPVRDILALTEKPDVISFAGGLPAPELFDAAEIEKAYGRVLSESPHRVLQYSTTEGDPQLREAIAERLGRRSFPTRPSDLMITTGSQQALSLVASSVLDPGDTVLVEDPTYLAALQCFRSAGARVLPVPCDAEGIAPEALHELVAHTRPKLLYLIPNFQNPTGRTLSLDRREAIAQVMARSGAWLVEDDPYGELRFEGSHIPWISSLAPVADRAVLLSSFSKIMAPGLRLGWLRAPESVRRACVVAKQAADLHTSTLDQAAAARYLKDADLDSHLARVRSAYGRRRDALLDGLPQALPAGSAWSTPAGGMFIWVKLPEEYDATTALRNAVTKRVAFVPGTPFFAGTPDRTTLRLSFTLHTVEEITMGLGRLGASFAR